ncbi:MAG: phosphotransferase [Planctomycetota bacterium]
MLDQVIESKIIDATGCNAILSRSKVQSLWSGYGSIDRYELSGGERASVVVKHVDLAGPVHQPRGGNTNKSHARKLHSYKVELAWYQRYIQTLPASCRVADCLLAESTEKGFLFILEDLDASGFCGRRSMLMPNSMEGCLDWLAQFHAAFLGKDLESLWPVGTYWHLATRPDELKAMPDAHPLRTHALELDRALSNCRFRTVVHGDAKVANFCFDEESSSVAAVDFQYVGGGCGMKDLAYFLGSCLDEDQCHEYAEMALAFYFQALRSYLANPTLADQIEQEWRALYPVAWADFNRFLIGWYPQHHKLHRYSKKMSDQAFDFIKRKQSAK